MLTTCTRHTVSKIVWLREAELKLINSGCALLRSRELGSLFCQKEQTKLDWTREEF